MKRTLSILVPTHTASDLDFFLMCQHSLRQMAELNEYVDVSIAITGQGAFTMKEFIVLKYKAHEFGIKNIGVSFQPIENPARLCYLRNCSAQIFPESNFYLILDHNTVMQVGSARRYIQAIDSLSICTHIGMIFCGSNRGGEAFGEMIVPYRDKHNSTSRGILVRNDLGYLFPPDTLGLAGSADESVLAVAANLRGLWVYKQWNNPTLHYPLELKDREMLEPGKEIKNNVHNWDVANANCFRWVKEKLGIPQDVDIYGKRFVNGFIDPKFSDVKLRQV